MPPAADLGRGAREARPLSYFARWTAAACRDLGDLERRDAIAADEQVLDLCEDPRRRGVRALQSGVKLFRIPFQAHRYRIVFSIEDDEGAITVVRISHRKDVYRQ